MKHHVFVSNSYIELLRLVLSLIIRHCVYIPADKLVVLINLKFTEVEIHGYIKSDCWIIYSWRLVKLDDINGTIVTVAIY